MIFILCDGLKGYLLLGLSKLEIEVKFLGLEDNSITSCPPLKIHPRHTGEIQCPVLCPRILHRHTYSVSRHNVSTVVFHPTPVEHSQTSFAGKHLTVFFISKKVWVVLWQNEWNPKNIRKQTLTFFHTVLPTWEQTAKSSNCPTAPSKNYRIR